MEFNGSQCIKSEVANETDMDSSAGHDHDECDNAALEPATETNEVATTDSDCQCADVSLNNSSMMNSSLDARHELKSSVSLKDTTHTDAALGAKSDESALDKKSLSISDASYDVNEMDNKSESAAEDNIQSSIKGDVAAMNSDSQCPIISLDDASVINGSLDCSHELKNPVSPGGTKCADPESECKLPESASGWKCLINSVMIGDRKEENKPELVSSTKDNTQSCKEGNIDAHALNLNEFAFEELKISVLAEESKCVGLQLEDKFAELTSMGKCLINSDASDDGLVMETKPVLDFPVEDITHSCKEGDAGDAHIADVDVARPKAVLSTVKTTTENSSNINEISDTFVSRSNGADESSMQIDTQPNNESMCDRAVKVDMCTEAVSEATHGEGSALHAMEGSFVTDVSEGKTESRCF